MDDAFGYWLSGFVDGEGSFQLNTPNNKKKDGINLCPRFVIDMRADEMSTLELIKENTGVGRVTFKPRDCSRALVKNSKPGCRFRVCAREELAVVVGIFRRYPLRAKKARDFEVWLRGVAILLDESVKISNHRGKPSWPLTVIRQFKALAKELRDGRAYRHPAAYTDSMRGTRPLAY